MTGFNFKSLDLFGLPVALNFAGSQKSTSKQGFICTIIVAAFVIWAIYNSGRNMVAKRNPSTITYDSFEQDPSRVVISEDNFPMAFGLLTPVTQKYTNFIDESYYVPVPFQNIFQTTKYPNGTVKAERIHLPIEYEVCTPEHFGKFKDSFSDVPLNSLYCFKKNQAFVKEIGLQGTITSTTFNGIGLSISVCKNSTTSPIICATPEKIKAKLTSSWLHVHYPQLGINPQNVTNPDLIFRQSFVTMLSPSTYKTATMDLGMVSITTDNGWLLEEKETNNFIKLSRVEEFLDINPNPDYMFNMLIQLDQLKVNYERSYAKIQDVLAQVQGLATTAILIVVIMMKPYSHLKFNESLINDIFDVKLAKRDKKHNKIKRTDISRAKTLKREDFSKPQKGKNTGNETEKIEIRVQSYEDKPVNTNNLLSEMASPTSLLSKESHRFLLGKDTVRQEAVKFIQMTHTLQKPTEHLTPKNLTSPVEAERGVLTSSPSENLIRDIIPKNTDKIPNKVSRSKAGRKLSTDQNNERRNLQPNASLAIEKPENIKIQVLSEPENEDFDFTRELADVSMTTKKEGELFEGEVKNNSIAFNKGINQTNQENEESFVPNNVNQNIIRQHNYEDDAKKTSQNPYKDNKGTYGGLAVLGSVLDEAYTDPYEYESKTIDITFWEYITSYIKKSDNLKEKMTVLSKGMKNIEERLDIFNIMRKFREIDKLKALLLEDDQIALFDAMPKAEVKAEKDNFIGRNKFMDTVLKNPKFVEWNQKQDQVTVSYKNISKKQKKSKIDLKLLAIYNEDFKEHY